MITPPEQATHTARWQQARALVLRHGWNSMAYQILNPGINHWLSPDQSAVVGYVAAAGTRVVAGAPICAPERLAEVAAAFAADTRRAGQRVCYFGAQDRLAGTLAAQGRLAQLVLGAQPVWQPQHWAAIIAGKSSLRAQIARARNKRVTVTCWPVERATDNPALRRCLYTWLQTRGLPPMHFLVETNTLAHLDDRRVFVAERDAQVLGFLLASPIPERKGWLVEQIIRGPDAPNGTSELLLDTAMRALADAGADYVTLGLSPLSKHGHAAESPQLFWMRALLRLTRAHGRRFYNFDGLDAFKMKFQPEGWEPIYALSDERWTSLRTMYAIAAVFGGASPVWFIGHALLRAATQELRWATRRWQQRAAA